MTAAFALIFAAFQPYGYGPLPINIHEVNEVREVTEVESEA